MSESNDVPTVDFIITKASQDPDTGERRWRATVSKFEADSQGDEVTKEFYNYAAQGIANGEYPIPALVVSHFDDPRPESRYTPTPDVFVAGITTDIYVDGDLPKAKGVFLDTALGHALYDAVKREDKANLPHEERTRISMAFRPEEGGIVKSEAGHTKFIKGSIRHFAGTRVPIVGRTNIEAGGLELKSENVRKTKRDDAASIVGDDLADKLYEEYSKVTKSKSDDNDLHFKAGTEFDMGACIEVKLGENKPRKQAIAICLDMARRGGAKVAPKKKSEFGIDLDQYIDELLEQSESDEELEEKFFHKRGNPNRDRRGRFAKRGTGDQTGRGSRSSRPSGFSGSVNAEEAARGGGSAGFGPQTSDLGTDIEASKEAKHEEIRVATQNCIKRLIRSGLEEEAAVNTCSASVKLRNRSYITKQGDSDMPEGSANLSDCISGYVEEGLSRSEARKKCADKRSESSDSDTEDKAEHGNGKPLSKCIKDRMANGASRKEAFSACMSNDEVKARLEAGHEKADVESILDAVISDGEVQVVLKADEDSSGTDTDFSVITYDEDLDAVYDQLDKLASDISENGKGREEGNTVEEKANTMEEETEDVNESSEEEKSDSESVEEVTINDTMEGFKSALADDSLEPGEKVLLVNHYLEQIGEYASEQIQQVPVTSDSVDTAEALKAALEETVSPLIQQIELLTAHVNEMGVEKSQQAGQHTVPSSKQLSPVVNADLSEKSEEEEGPVGAMSAGEIAEQTVTMSTPIY